MGNIKKVPLRKCIGCNEMKNKKEMMRVLKTPEGEIVLDVTGRKNGRGAYLCFSKECLQKAIKNKGLERSLKMQIPQEVYENLNCNKVLSLIGLSTKAGKIVSGEFSTEKAVKTGKAWLVIVSAEASDNTKKKFHNMCTYYEVPCYDFGGKEELGRAMGKEFRASLAVTDENLAAAMEKQLKSE